MVAFGCVALKGGWGWIGVGFGGVDSFKIGWDSEEVGEVGRVVRDCYIRVDGKIT